MTRHNRSIRFDEINQYRVEGSLAIARSNPGKVIKRPDDTRRTNVEH